MQECRSARTLSSILVIALVACGSNDSGSGVGADSGADSTGGIGPGAEAGGGSDSGTPCDPGDAGDVGRRCSLSMPVSGGLTGTFDGMAGCSVGGGTNASVGWTSRSLGGQVTAVFGTAPPNQAGTFPLASLKIEAGTVAASQSWTAPSGACTLTITSVDMECQSAYRQVRPVIHGTGTCTQPAAPDNGTSGSPVTIGDFQFVHWL
jgi:hypothetical protein